MSKNERSERSQWVSRVDVIVDAKKKVPRTGWDMGLGGWEVSEQRRGLKKGGGGALKRGSQLGTLSVAFLPHPLMLPLATHLRSRPPPRP